MSNTITAIFRTADVARQVETKITEIGVPQRNIHTISGTDRSSEIDTLHLPQDEASTYRQAIMQGHYVVSADVEEDMTQDVADIMRHPEDGVDIDAYETDYRSSPDYVAETEVAYDADTPYRANNDEPDAYNPSSTNESETTIELAEERLVVGKRVTEDGGSAHVRTYVHEVPVEERIRLREERLSVERHPTDRVVTGAEADNLFQDRDIEVTTRSEEAVISKEAVVTEEVVVGKEVSEREEVIKETLRKTDVDIDGNTDPKKDRY